MTIEVGKTYTDGWGVKHTIGGVVAINPDWLWSVQGDWFRKADGRRISYVLVDKTKPDGARRHVPAAKASNWDLSGGDK